MMQYLPLLVSLALFFAVPLVLWRMATLTHGKAARLSASRSPRNALLSAFVAGADNRLSLSRLQMFAWTLVIFGSYVAANAIRVPYEIGTPEQVAQADAEVADAGRRVTAIDLQRRSAVNDAARHALDSALHSAEATHASAADAAARFHWLVVPLSLLALAGLSAGTGVFSGLISATQGSGKHACITSLTVRPFDDALQRDFPEIGRATEAGVACAVLFGRDYGAGGQVRFDGDYASILLWKTDGPVIIAEIPRPAGEVDTLKQLVIDSPNGKLGYELLSGNGKPLHLGPAKTTYEYLDLFRDDGNPRTLSLTKFQMFGWTAIALALYTIVLFRALRQPGASHLASLPEVDATLVALMGLSQIGYLTGKAVSGMDAGPSRSTVPAATGGAGPPRPGDIRGGGV